MASTREGIERQNLTARISAQLAEELMAGDLKPGQPLVLRELAEQFGVSQTPVREALLQLVSEGALAMSPSRSIQVPEVSRERLHELRELRVMLECYAGRTAAALIQPDTVEVLRDIHRRMWSAARERRTRDALVLNKQFHMMLYSQSDMPTTVAIIRQLWMRMAPYLNYIHYPKSPPHELFQDGHPHEAILQGLEQHDPEQVHRGIERDLRFQQQHLNDNLDAVFPREPGAAAPSPTPADVV